MGKVRNKPIDERINRCVMSEMGESVRTFGKILQRGNVSLHDCGDLDLFSLCDMN